MSSLLILGLVGLVAQLVDGSLGMGYGVTSTTLLLSAGVAPAVASATVHLAKVGTTLASGASHWRLGNVDWRTVGVLAVPGGAGAFAGATVLSDLPADSAAPWVAGLLVVLGVYIVWRFFARGTASRKQGSRLSAWFLVPLGLVAGGLDSLGGGGWGPVGTTSLLSSGRLHPRKVVGSISASELVVAVGSSLGFFFALDLSAVDLGGVGMLLLGGVVAAPLAAWLVSRLPARILGIGAGGLIVLTNVQTVTAAVDAPAGMVAGLLIVLGVAWVALVAGAVRAHRRHRERPEPASTPAGVGSR